MTNFDSNGEVKEILGRCETNEFFLKRILNVLPKNISPTALCEMDTIGFGGTAEMTALKEASRGTYCTPEQVCHCLAREYKVLASDGPRSCRLERRTSTWFLIKAGSAFTAVKVKIITSNLSIEGSVFRERDLIERGDVLFVPVRT